MAFKLVISEGKDSHQLEVPATESKPLVGLRIGEEFDASNIGLNGYTLKITGGSDKNGFPMKKDVDGPRRIKSLLAGGTGFKPKRDGQRRRKTVRGNTVSDDIVQISAVVAQKGKKSIEELLKTDE
ncbi:MAG: 30S ribosomal protein S6e [Methanobacterium sp.]|nr:30S ribosomal protein S6e [Methanobacterium sp.]